MFLASLQGEGRERAARTPRRYDVCGDCEESTGVKWEEKLYLYCGHARLANASSTASFTPFPKAAGLRMYVCTSGLGLRRADLVSFRLMYWPVTDNSPLLPTPAFYIYNPRRIPSRRRPPLPSRTLFHRRLGVGIPL